MKQQQGVGGRISSLPVEDFNAIDISGAVIDSHSSPFVFLARANDAGIYYQPLNLSSAF
jgi:hypothetical protein